jgi:hypothetical protein
MAAGGDEMNVTVNYGGPTFSVVVGSATSLGGVSGVTDHGALTGLGDDDHPQYHNNARGDLRYEPIGLVASTLAAHLAAADPHNQYALESSIGVAGGIAPLDGSAKIAASYLPAYVDDVLEFANLAAFPGTGSAGVIYVALDTNKVYRWGGSSYTEISPSPGSTDAVPEGATNKYFTTGRVLSTVLVGLSLVSSSAITSASTVLEALGQLQAQNTAQDTAISGKQASSSKLTDIAGLSYTGNALKVLQVNAGETGVAWATVSASPAGAGTELQYRNGGAFGAMSGTAWDDTNRSLVITGATVTTSKPILDLSQTWNAGAVVFDAIKLNITSNASAATSAFLTMQLASTTQAQVNKIGQFFSLGVLNQVAYGFTNDQTTGFSWRQAGQPSITCSGSEVWRFTTTSTYFFGTVIAFGGSGDTGFARNAAGVVEINSSTAGTFRDLKLRNLLAGGGNGSYVQTPSMTVANLAAAATAGSGARAFVTDATATTFLSTVAGGGANKVPVVSDGTNWLIG